jgi:LmbE family N-acetylglucosaminyl deacetylase
MKHVYLSPHLDDAVLSCGGAIHHQIAAGEQVTVITIFAGDADPDTELPAFALTQHEYWGNPPAPMALRRAEDVAALRLLGATAHHLDYPDAVYRASANGEWLYNREQTLWEEVHPDDPLGKNGLILLAEHVADLIPQAVAPIVYAPLGLGHHVDHQIVHAVARQLLSGATRMAFYEDYPYGEKPGALEAALLAAGAQEWRVEIVALDAADITAKIAALAYYRTQLDGLFGSVEAMPNRIWSFCTSRSPQANLAERIWWPSET